MAFRKKVITTEDVKPDQPSDIILRDGTLATSNTIIQSGVDALHGEYLDDLAFMEEEMTVMVQETSDENAENPVTIGCNGTFKQFFRGQPIVAKRKFVDGLIVKSGRVSTPEYINGAGERARSIRQQSAHRFPFMVIKDNSPKGAAWLSQRLSEAI